MVELYQSHQARIRLGHVIAMLSRTLGRRARTTCCHQHTYRYAYPTVSHLLVFLSRLYSDGVTPYVFLKHFEKYRESFMPTI